MVEADDYCFSSMMFTSVVGVVTVLLLMSGTQTHTHNGPHDRDL